MQNLLRVFVHIINFMANYKIMSFQNILVERKGSVACITINRPEKLNALNRATIQELSNAFKSANDDKEIRVIVLTGAGEKAFVAGADISEFANFSHEEGMKLAHDGQESLFNLVELMTKPVIAAVNGFALGGGLELAMSCHIRLASENAKMGLPEVTLGVIPGYGGTQRLPRLIGRGRASQLIFSAEMITADLAEKWGLVNKVVPQSDLLTESLALADKIAKNSPTAISNAIVAIEAGYTSGKDGFNTEIECFGKSFSTQDFKEGTTAFLEKRKPVFLGE